MYRNLIFFVSLFVLACAEKTAEVKVIWADERAVGIVIPHLLTGSISESQPGIVVRLLEGRDSVSMLGNVRSEKGDIIFEPLVPFTRGLRYEVLVNGTRIAELKIPEVSRELAPELLAIYPTQDTVPENLLKVYLHFSKPMRDGTSARHVTLLQNSKDTVKGAFLDLQPELWNENHTLLTLWLDPGRIKRDLIPNQLMGTPLQKGNHYTLVISQQWQDTQNAMLSQSYRKEFFVAERDSIVPNPQIWKFSSAEAGTTDALRINLKLPLDFSLLFSCLRIQNEKNELVEGKWEIAEEETKIMFLPQQKWRTGNYSCIIETRLEDLAGNNMNRLFDTDISKKQKADLSRAEIFVHFVVK